MSRHHVKTFVFIENEKKKEGRGDQKISSKSFPPLSFVSNSSFSKERKEVEGKKRKKKRRKKKEMEQRIFLWISLILLVVFPGNGVEGGLFDFSSLSSLLLTSLLQHLLQHLHIGKQLLFGLHILFFSSSSSYLSNPLSLKAKHSFSLHLIR